MDWPSRRITLFQIFAVATAFGIFSGLQAYNYITLFTDLCERTRSDAFNQMLAHAQEQGANAVIGIRYDATEILNGVTEVLCYGTAVVVERADG